MSTDDFAEILRLLPDSSAAGVAVKRIVIFGFKHCRVEIDYDDLYLQTVFEDASFAPARPNFTEDDIRRAHMLGYHGNTWLMSLEHEPLHTYVSESLGEPYSRILWNVAHGGGLRWPEGGREEEGYVTSLQAYLRRGQISDMLHGFLDRAHEASGWSKMTIIDDARLLLARVRKPIGV